MFTHTTKNIFMVGSQYNDTTKGNQHAKRAGRASTATILLLDAIHTLCTVHNAPSVVYTMVRIILCWFNGITCFCVYPRCGVRLSNTWKHGASYCAAPAAFQAGDTVVVYFRTLPRMCDTRRTLAPDSSAFRSKSSRSNVQLNRQDSNKPRKRGLSCK